MRRVLIVLCFTLALLSSLYAKKKIKAPSAPAAPQMTSDQKILHALNRLTFGARAGDMDEVKQIGLDAWMPGKDPDEFGSTVTPESDDPDRSAL